MKIELDENDLKNISERVVEAIRPLILSREKAQDQGEVIFDVRGLSEYLKVTPSWIYKMISLKAIPYSKVGKFPRFRRKEIEKWIESKAVRPVPSLKIIKTRGAAT